MPTDVFAVRALNSCRLRHKPTYVALRALLDCDTDPQRSQRLVRAAVGKTLTPKDWRYYSYPVLKELEDGKTPLYRDCLVGSPFALLAEATVLWEMSQQKAFSPPPNVYSYLWPKSADSGHNFRFYRYGYSLRNRRIAALLSENPGHVAVVNDLRKFYPSVRWAELQPRIDRRLLEVKDAGTRKKIAGFIDVFRRSSKHGIAIGPDVSHVLANVALEDLDAGMSREFGKRYFRYVDDIIVICEPNDAGRVQTQLKSAVERHDGLKLHEGKRDVVAGITWERECPKLDQGVAPGSFEELLHDLQTYLLVFPKELEALRKAFRLEGFSFPFQRLVAQVNYGPFRRFAVKFFQKRPWWLRWNGIEGLLSRAKTIRESLRTELLMLRNSGAQGDGMRRRWFVQTARYRISRLLYLLDRTAYGDLLESIPLGVEFSEYRSLVSALRDGDPMNLLLFPGAVISTFCELAAEDESLRPPSQWPSLQERAASESAAALAIYFGWAIPHESTVPMYQGSRVLLEIMNGNVQNRELIRPQSYLDELELILRDVPHELRSRYVRTRLSDQESIGLEGLAMGGASLT